MKKVKILIVEDELVIAMNICDILDDLGYDALDPVTNFEDAIEQIETETPDIVLIDIQIDGNKSGIDLAKVIQTQHQLPFIFLTSNSDSATINLAKQTNPSSYLVKPFNQDDLYSSIEIALHNFSKTEVSNTDSNVFIKDSIFVKNKNMFYKVKIDDIMYVKSEHVYVELYTVNEKKHLIRSSISAFTNRLPDHFFRTHRSFTVNLNHLDAINSFYVEVKGEQIPIGKTFRSELLERVQIE